MDIGLMIVNNKVRTRNASAQQYWHNHLKFDLILYENLFNSITSFCWRNQISGGEMSYSHNTNWNHY
jgi:hypothetical protein